MRRESDIKPFAKTAQGKPPHAKLRGMAMKRLRAVLYLNMIAGELLTVNGKFVKFWPAGKEFTLRDVRVRVYSKEFWQ